MRVWGRRPEMGFGGGVEMVAFGLRPVA
ncbi:hypothetical protein CCACVL1_21498 [Corchorus capsularis]|uniref:Uncharacterized protein n=1 Tax=Corchorus capsularis TaxID=210143 RepID=A0A1R3H5F9_COCAP|nr:hypothetical protein CCACVL1_21498 [Corchorus capsularis]